MTRMITETRSFPLSQVPDGIPQFVTWLLDIQSQLPPDSRQTATIEFEAVEVYEDIECSIDISWERPETAEEEHRRVHRDAAMKAAKADGWRAKRPWDEMPDKYYPPLPEPPIVKDDAIASDEDGAIKNAIAWAWSAPEDMEDVGGPEHQEAYRGLLAALDSGNPDPPATGTT